MYRARAGKFHCARDLGSPPREAAKFSNRMTAAGVSAFYGAIDPLTAELEVRALSKKALCVTVGAFVPTRDLIVVDLSAAREVPSLFDQERRRLRSLVRFYQQFSAEISEPIKKDGLEHIQYVPTQVVTDFIRHEYRHKRKPIDGIIYRSASKGGTKSLVIFAENDQCVDHDDDSKNALLKMHSCHTGRRKSRA